MEHCLPLVRAVAADVRAEMFKLAKKVNDEEWGINKRDLGGACGIASYTLSRILRALGIRTELRFISYGFGGHCWLVLKGTEVALDVTATQFSSKKKRVTYPDILLDAQHRHAIYNDPDAEEHKRGADVAKFLQHWGQQSPYTYWKHDLRKIYRRIAKKYLRRKAFRDALAAAGRKGRRAVQPLVVH